MNLKTRVRKSFIVKETKETYCPHCKLWETRDHFKVWPECNNEVTHKGCNKVVGNLEDKYNETH